MKKYFALITILLAAVACKKSKDDVTPDKSTLEKLTNGSSKVWTVKEGKVIQNGIEIDLIASQNPCVTDNEITLYTNFDYEFQEGKSKCNANDPQLILKAKWQLNADEQSMSIDRFIFLGRSVNNPTFTLENVSDTEFSGSTNLTIDNQNFDVKVTFKTVN